MRTKVGLWIDHRKALIVAVTDKGEEIRLIISKVEKQPGRSVGLRSTTPYESRLVSAKAGCLRLSNWKKVSQLIN
jgi:hypothetical protein